jgi:CubicO group peptidase (beta-lactamase class C family)
MGRGTAGRVRNSRIAAGVSLLALLSCASGGANAPGAEPPLALSASSAQPLVAKRVHVAQGQAERARFADPDRASKIAALFEQQRGDLETELKALGAPGFAWGLVVDGRLLASGAGGTTRVDGGAPVTPATVFRIGSITKVFTALALLRLRDQGALSLDAPLRDALPEFDGVVYPTADSPLITARHVLTQHSGLPRLGGFVYTNPDAPPTERGVLAALDGAELRDVPGASYEYSNFGFSLLGLLVSRVAKQPFDAYISEHVLAPLGMSHSAWSASAIPEALLARPHQLGSDGKLALVREWSLGASAGAGGLYSSVEDLARFAAYQLSASPPSSTPESPVLARASLRESQDLQLVESLRLRKQDPPAARVTGEGLGWAVYRDCRFEQVTWHNGGTEGHRAALYLLPTRGVAAIILANLGGADVDGLALRMLTRLHDGGVLPERQAVLALSDLWRQRVDATLALGQHFDRATFEQLFDEGVHQVLTPENMQPWLERRYATFGTCRAGAPLPSRDGNWQAASLVCEKGEPRAVEAALSPQQKLTGFWLGTPEAQAERARARAGAPGESGRACVE